MTRTIDTVLFDLDDTLHDDTTAYRNAARRVADDLAESAGIDREALLAAYVREAESFWKGLTAASILEPMNERSMRARLWLRALEAVGVHDEALADVCARRYATYRNEGLIPLPGAVELLDSLRANGIRVGIVTNGIAATHHDKIALLGLTQRVDAVFIADEVKMVKPDPRLFLHACETLGSSPVRTAMVGDRYFRDVTGANEAGLFTIYIDVHRETRPADGVVPDAIVETIGEVGAVLDPLLVRAPLARG